MSTSKTSICLMYLLLAACAGKQPPAAPAEPASTETSGVEQPAEAEEEEDEPEEVRAPESGPAKLTIITKVAGAEIPASIKIRGPDGSLLAEGAQAQRSRCRLVSSRWKPRPRMLRRSRTARPSVRP